MSLPEPVRAWRSWAPWCCVAFVLSAWVAWVPLEGIPHVTDEIAYTLQSRLFAAGLRTGPPVEQPTMWTMPFFAVEGRTHSPFPPGWPALLSLGERLGLAWLVNPLLAGLFPALTFGITRGWTQDPKTATLAAAAASVSPAAILLGASRMSHTAVLTALAVVLLAVVRRPQTQTPWLAAGLAAGFVVLARPFDAALIAGPLLLFALWRAPRGPARGTLVVLPGLAAALLLADNAHLTGDPFTFPMSEFLDGWTAPRRPDCNRLGFGEDVGCSATFGTFGHTPDKALQIAWRSARVFDRLSWGAPLGLVLAAAGLVRLRKSLPLLLLVLPPLGYALYWSPGEAYGARFWHPMLLVVPTGIALSLRRTGRLALPSVVAIGVAGIGWVLPDLGDRYWCVDGQLKATVEAQNLEAGTVFLDGRGVRKTSWPRLGNEAFVCDPMLEAGDGFLLLDPAAPMAGVRVRHALRDPAHIDAYRSRYGAGEPALYIRHDVATDRREVETLD